MTAEIIECPFLKNDPLLGNKAAQLRLTQKDAWVLNAWTNVV